jgi:cytidine deaminase
MQDQSQLNEKDLELIKTAGNHAKERFKSGKVYTGINLKYRVRNASTCAEALAIYAALNDGESEFDTVVGAKYFPETDSFEVVNGCGWCRQLFSYNTPLDVIIDKEGKLEVVKAEALMPYAFL